MKFSCPDANIWVVLCMHPANERQRYIVISSPFGWAHTQDDPCKQVWWTINKCVFICIHAWSYNFNKIICITGDFNFTANFIMKCWQEACYPILSVGVGHVLQILWKEICKGTEIILCMCPANERRRYNVMSSLIDWTHSQNYPWKKFQVEITVECQALIGLRK